MWPVPAPLKCTTLRYGLPPYRSLAALLPRSKANTAPFNPYACSLLRISQGKIRLTLKRTTCSEVMSISYPKGVRCDQCIRVCTRPSQYTGTSKTVHASRTKQWRWTISTPLSGISRLQLSTPASRKRANPFTAENGLTGVCGGQVERAKDELVFPQAHVGGSVDNLRRERRTLQMRCQLKIYASACMWAEAIIDARRTGPHQKITSAHDRYE